MKHCFDIKYLFKRFLTSGKNIPIAYYICNMLKYFIPKIFYRRDINHKKISKRKDYQYILDRVNYYNKLKSNQKLSSSRIQLKNFKRKGFNSRYFFDTYEYTKYFNQNLYSDPLFGDIVVVPDSPRIVKSRPIADNNQNSVLFKLNKLRHFVFLYDTIRFSKKKDKAIFMSFVTWKPHREDFMTKFHSSKICFCGNIDINGNPEWYCKKKSLWEHLKYKFIVTLEGNDVATNLKWVMSSNSIAVMPKPKYETWFMEGQLIGDYHYIHIKDDYSDFEEKLTYYMDNPNKAEEIIKNANNHVKQFKNKKREHIISLLVLDKYLTKVN